jgi:hypothetical protein
MRRAAALAAVLVVALGVVAAPAGAAAPVEGYHDPGNRIGCVMYAFYDSNGNAVRCGAKGKSRGLLLRSAGAASRVSWSWPARTLGNLFFTATYSKTLYLIGGTAKLDGSDADLRCVFRRSPSVRVRCTNGGGYAIEITRTKARRIAP